MGRRSGLAILTAVFAFALLAAGASGARPVLYQPLDLLPLPDGHLVVTDLSGSAVYDIDPARRTGRLLARVSQAREPERLTDGRILVTSGPRVLALDPRTGKTPSSPRPGPPSSDSRSRPAAVCT